MCFLLKNYSLVESVCLEVLPAKHNTDRNNVKEQNRHWKGGGGTPALSLDAFEFLFFEKAREESKDVDTFLSLRVIKKQKPAIFF